MDRRILIASVAVSCLASSACNRRVLGVLFDLPQDPATQETTTAPGPRMPADLLVGNVLMMPVDTIVPEIEKTLDPDSVVAMLPRDHAGNIDWMAALRHEIIRPRDGIDGPRSDMPGEFEFKFDFYFPGPNEMFDAYFPHSAHTEWMDCAQCHPRIFKTRGVEIKMADVFAGKFCGECHGKVAYPVMTGCERCHTGMAQPPDRAQPELIGTVEMRRATEILAERRRDSLAALPAAQQPQADSGQAGDTTGVVVAGNAAGVNTFDFARAKFPHWVHRIRYRCKTCHMEIFEPRAGSNVITMADIGRGEACGRCHNGRTAFEAGLTTCERCHPPPQAQPRPAVPEEADALAVPPTHPPLQPGGGGPGGQ